MGSKPCAMLYRNDTDVEAAFQDAVGYNRPSLVLLNHSPKVFGDKGKLVRLDLFKYAGCIRNSIVCHVSYKAEVVYHRFSSRAKLGFWYSKQQIVESVFFMDEKTPIRLWSKLRTGSSDLVCRSNEVLYLSPLPLSYLPWTSLVEYADYLFCCQGLATLDLYHELREEESQILSWKKSVSLGNSPASSYLLTFLQSSKTRCLERLANIGDNLWKSGRYLRMYS